ncbi:hypothetical protein PGT21_022875 [Puccinia graminis f. sp. tritici]|uniref:Uncharacterized protein n=1 Tax=Puccinia graminis f. sp. tritici TaxID=56615 RepID=A0A5B0QWT5_PUCGR|nr:hypothetical protein PGT21_022875 [Puccinia graminis f. sp. tritici]
MTIRKQEKTFVSRGNTSILFRLQFCSSCSTEPHAHTCNLTSSNDSHQRLPHTVATNECTGERQPPKRAPVNGNLQREHDR